MNKELILERIEELCRSEGISLNTAFIESGVGKNFKSNLKTSNPSVGKLTMLAGYFGVTLEYITGEKSDTETKKLSGVRSVNMFAKNRLTDHEWALIQAYRLHPNKQAEVDRLLEIESGGMVLMYRASTSTDNRPDMIIAMPREQFEKINNAPITDETLL